MPQDDPYKYFRVEVAELVELLGQAALDIGKGAPVAGGVAALLRYAHTLKGAARVVRQPAIADRAHTIEDVLAPYRTLGTQIPPGIAPALLTELDAVSAAVGLLGPLPAAAPVPVALARAGAQKGTAAPEEHARTLRTDVSDVEAVVDGLGESLVELEGLRGSLRELEEIRRLSEILERQLAAPRREDPEKLGLVVERAKRVTEDLGTGLRRLDRGLRQSLERLRRDLVETHASAERLRLIPVSGIFVSLERAVVDAAEELEKRVVWKASGGDVRLDGHVLGVAQTALLHVVRNAVVHGLERESQRLAAGKSASGTIELSVRRLGGDVVFACRDDGAGLDVDALRRALDRSGEARVEQTDEELLAHLLESGVSTSGTITRLAGRGVGLDVVRESADRLGGKVTLQSRRGQGFSVELRLPLTVSAFSGISVECDGRTLSLPLEAVLETTRFLQSEIAHTATGDSVCHEGQVIPFAPLSRVLGRSTPDAAGACSALIVRAGGSKVAVSVDRLLGARLVVLRSLPSTAGASDVVAGASLDSLGNPELVLDADGLVAAVQRLSGVRASTGLERRPILIIDDSLTTRMLEQSILESAGYQVELATSAEEGLVKARNGQYSLFLVDVEMPGIDGFTFVDRARRDPDFGNVPAVLVSSRSAPEDLARGKAAGAFGYIVKDRFDQRELLGLIRQLVDGA